jgi:Zn finger protein HypA/HybF involved in hydrogenase expression
MPTYDIICLQCGQDSYDVVEPKATSHPLCPVCNSKETQIDITQNKYSYRTLLINKQITIGGESYAHKLRY